MRIFGLLILTTALFVLSGCDSSSSQPRNSNAGTPPPAPTSAPIPNLNASDLQKGRRPEQNRETAPNTNVAPPPPAKKGEHFDSDKQSFGGQGVESAASDKNSNK